NLLERRPGRRREARRPAGARWTGMCLCHVAMARGRVQLHPEGSRHARYRSIVHHPSADGRRAPPRRTQSGAGEPMTTEEQASPAPQRPFPTEGSTDELLHDPPDLGVGGTLEGYRRGARMRFVLIGFGAVLVGVLAVLGWWITRPRPVVPEYTVAPDHATDPADRVLHW